MIRMECCSIIIAHQVFVSFSVWIIDKMKYILRKIREFFAKPEIDFKALKESTKSVPHNFSDMPFMWKRGFNGQDHGGVQRTSIAYWEWAEGRSFGIDWRKDKGLFSASYEKFKIQPKIEI